MKPQKASTKDTGRPFPKITPKSNMINSPLISLQIPADPTIS